VKIWPSVQHTQKSFSTIAGDPTPILAALSRTTATRSAAGIKANLSVSSSDCVDDGRRPLRSLVHQLAKAVFGIRRESGAELLDNPVVDLILANCSQGLKCSTGLSAGTKQGKRTRMLEINHLFPNLDAPRTAVVQIYRLRRDLRRKPKHVGARAGDNSGTRTNCWTVCFSVARPK